MGMGTRRRPHPAALSYEEFKKEMVYLDEKGAFVPQP